MNKKLLLIGIILVIAVVIITTFILDASASVTKDENILKIRLTAPLTGNNAYYGIETKQALELYFNDYSIELKNKGITLDYAVQDNTGTPVESTRTAQLFLAEENVDLLISTNTPLSQPIIPLAESNKVNLLALVTGARDFAVDQNYTFRDAILSYESGEYLAEYLASNKKLKIATLVVNDDYGLSAANGLKDKIQSLGGEVVAQELFTGTDTDLKTQIYKIKSKNPDVILFVGREKSIIIGIQQMTESKINLDTVYSINAYESPTVVNGLGDLATKIKFVSMYYTRDDKATNDFFIKYIDAYGTEPGIYAIDAYSAAQYIIYCAEKYGATSKAINDCFKNDKFKTIKGDIYFNSKNDLTVNYGLFQYNSNYEKKLI